VQLKRELPLFAGICVPPAPAVQGKTIKCFCICGIKAVSEGPTKQEVNPIDWVKLVISAVNWRFWRSPKTFTKPDF